MSALPPKLRILVAPSEIDANASCIGYPKFIPSSACSYPGWCLEILNVILSSGNISHEFIVDKNTSYVDWGRLKDDGHFSGVLGRVESGEVDMTCLMYQKSVLRLEYFDFTVTVSEIQPTFIIREIPVTLWSLMGNCLRPYDTNVWICMLAAILAQIIVWAVIGRMEVAVGLRPARDNAQYFAWDVLDDLFNGSDNSFHSISGKLTRFILLVFQKGLLLGMYSALLLTALITPVDNAPIKSQADIVNLISTGQYKLISDKSKWFAQEISMSSEKLFVDLREATKTNPIVEISESLEKLMISNWPKTQIDVIDDAHGLDLVGKGGYIFQSQNDGTTMVEVAGKCYTFVYSQGLPYRSAHFLLRKGSPWISILNKEIMRNYPFIDNLRKSQAPKCEPGMFATPGATDPLNFWSVSGIFLLGSCGLIIALVSLIVEKIVSKACKARR